MSTPIQEPGGTGSADDDAMDAGWLPVLDRGERAAVARQMRGNARAGVDFYVMILLSSSIAFFGLVQNSVAVIIGAMLVAPLMSPMIAIGHSIVMGNLFLFRTAALSTCIGMCLAIASAALMTAVLPFLDLVQPGSEILGRTHPNMLDQYIALASGAAAAYALSRKGVAAALPGVAIAAALVPPLCVVGYCLGSQRFELAGGAMLLFLTNLAAIVFSSAAVFMLLGFRPTRDDLNQNVRHGVTVAIVGLLVVTVPLALATWSSIRELEARVIVKTAVAELYPQEIARVDELSVRFVDSASHIELTAFSLLEDASRKQQRVRQDQLLAKLEQQLRRDLAMPFTLSAVVVDSRLSQGGMSEEGQVAAP